MSARPMHLPVPLLWVSALARRRSGRLAATALGIALAVALLVSLGTFLAASRATMTRRAIETVAVDWQVEAQPGADPAAVAATVSTASHTAAVEPVRYGTTTGFELTSGGATRTTGPGVVVGIDNSYRSTFPGQVRDLIGAPSGVLVYQQTAANLAAAPGDSITVNRAGLPPMQVTVDGVVDLPQADSLFQAVGAPTGAQAQAPPDNVLIVPTAVWHQLFDALDPSHADQVHEQLHVRLDHHLPADPAAAYSTVLGQANNIEAQLPGTGRVGNNIGAALSAARSDALYAQVVFLFLGTPGAILAGLLTAAIAGSAHQRRRREQALLRTRGATVRQLTRIGITEAAVVGMAGAAVGIGVAWLVGRVAFGTGRFGATTATAIGWTATAALVGLTIAGLTVAVPAIRDARALTVVAARRNVSRQRNPRWMRFGLDTVALAGALVVFWLAANNGYKLVLAVEGVPSISVSYWAFAGPALLWIAIGLISYRIITMVVSQGRPLIAGGLRPIAGGLSGTIAASLQRQRRVVARGAAIVALAVGFAASTAIFDATYQQQAAVDAVLSNGADVTVTTSPGASVSPTSTAAQQIAGTAGVRNVEPLQHRFAYVGTDLQDLYGVRPSTVIDAGRLQDAYFAGGSAHSLIEQLATKPDSLLVSAETVHDFQLQVGDPITLRLQDGVTKQYTDVPFHYVGIAKEFPTAPHDSFLLANADYIAARTGSDAVGAFLVDTGSDPTAVAGRLRAQLGATATVTDIVTTRAIVGSSLTAVDLDGLTKVELGFALALAAAATGLTLWLGLTERRRTFSIAAALGANRRQLAGFVWAEAAIVVIGGIVLGAVGAWGLSVMLTRVLTGVFDPPPASLAVPWRYLAVVLAVSIVAAAVAVTSTLRSARTAGVEALRTP